MIGLDRLHHPLCGERGFRRREIACEPHRDLAFDADTDIVAIAQLGAAVANALREYTAAAGMGDVEILLHHRAGAADLVTDQAACLRQQQMLDPVRAFEPDDLIAGHELRRKRG